MYSKKFLIWWNNTFPLDRWYRKKYGIAFGSSEHKSLCQISIKAEYLEEAIFKEHEYRSILEKEYRSNGKWLKTQKFSKEKQEELFAKIDQNLDVFDDVEFGNDLNEE